MRFFGYNPDEFYLYILYQSGHVAPFMALREDYWHFDLLRNLRSNQDKIPLSIEYNVCSCLPTLYATVLRSKNSEISFKARSTIEDIKSHQVLGDYAAQNGNLFQAQVGEIVRYNNFVLHKGSKNSGHSPLHRVFLNISFSPVF